MSWTFWKIINIIELFNIESNETINIQHTDTYKVSQILLILNQYKAKYFEKGQIPSFKNQFEINLFNTFRSYINLENFTPFKYNKHIIF